MANKRYEQIFCSKLNKWWEYVGSKYFDKTLLIEAKISTSKRFNYKAGIRPHQLPTLIKYKYNPVSWKISDADQMSTKHYDIIASKEEVVIPCIAIKWIRRGNKKFYLIDPDVIQGRIDDGHKSLTEDEAKELCFYKGVIK